jgi:hypothetical protein
VSEASGEILSAFLKPGFQQRASGHSDGGDIGTGTMNIFCYAADTKSLNQ